MLYTPLSQFMIRLATIKYTKPLCIVLKTYSVFDCTYDALSYTWGSPIEAWDSSYSEHKQIIVNGYRTRITRNLYEALEALAAFKTQLWIDALCINQNDFDEKCEQISLMTMIYTRAQRVYCWVGVDDGTFKHVVELYKSAEQWISKELSRDGDTLKARDGTRVSVESILAFYDFCSNRRYLRRAWVMQEVVVSNAYMLLNGQLLDVKAVACIAAKLQQHAFKGRALNQGDEHLVRLGTHATRYRSDYVSAICKIDGELQHGASNWLVLWLNLLSRAMDATHPRDIFLAMYGLVSGSWIPDPRSSFEQLSRELTILTLQELPFASVLSFTPSEISWIPDFRKGSRTFQGLIVATANASTHKDSPLPAPILLRRGQTDFSYGVADHRSHLKVIDDRLILFGRRCSVINATFSLRLIPSVRESATGMATVALWCLNMQQQHKLDLESLFRALGFSMQHNGGVDSQEFSERVRSFFLMAAGNMTWDANAEPLTKELIQQLELYREPCLPTVQEVIWMQEVMRSREYKSQEQEEAVRRCIDSLREAKYMPICVDTSDILLFSTEAGQVGRCTYEGARAGDELWMITKAKVPFVLRRHDERDFQLISEVFISDAMHGQMIDNGIASAERRIALI
ncbi:hypothetical protein AMS68_000230 [Peltaster fructicola]|uniref:Heterokaryon incompatibility domain-containing protein n=1 Tax=Peltaster fructicola TaxID=286661 RepID=A0A6H0XJ09_9PEZI|nr:hypothetical protein AMS68_000230 [Peltaster fructicola]